MKLDMSPDFTVDDIRRVRDYYYEVTKDMTPNEEKAYFEAVAEPGLAEIERLRALLKRQ